MRCFTAADAILCLISNLMPGEAVFVLFPAKLVWQHFEVFHWFLFNFKNIYIYTHIYLPFLLCSRNVLHVCSV